MMTIYLTLQGSESDATITTADEVKVEGWKDTDAGILSLFRDSALCHEGGGILTEYFNCNGSVGHGKLTPYEVLVPGVRLPKFVFGDLNGDGIDDVVAISEVYDDTYDSWTKAFLMPSKTLVWERTDPDLCGMAVIGDANSDGKNEVLIATDYGYFHRESSVLYMVSGDNGENLWVRDDLGVIKRSYPSIWEGAVVIGDVNGDGLNEVIVGSEDGLFVLDGANGSTLWSYTEYPKIHEIIIVDVDNDGVNEIVAEAFDTRTLFALSAVTKTKLWENTEVKVSLHSAKVGYVYPGPYPNLVALDITEWLKLAVFSLDNGEVMWTSGYFPGACAHSRRPPDLMDINGDGYKEVFATSDTHMLRFFDGRDGTNLKGHSFEGINHLLDFDEERKIVVVGSDETALRLVLLNSIGDVVWNVDAGIGVYEEYPGDLGFLLPVIFGDYIFALIASSYEGQPDQYLVLARLSDGYIFRKYPFAPFRVFSPSTSETVKADMDGDGIDEMIIPTTTDVNIIKKSILYDREIYEPSSHLPAGTYVFTLNLHDEAGGLIESVSRTLTVLEYDKMPTVIPVTTPPPATVGTGVAFTFAGDLQEEVGLAGLADKPVDLYVDGIKQATGTTDVDGHWAFSITVDTPGTHAIYVNFAGDAMYIGCAKKLSRGGENA